MFIFVMIQLLIALSFLVLGLVIRIKKAYGLISGFSNRPLEEQQQLIDLGLPQKTGALLIATAAGMLLLLPMSFTSFSYTLEIQFGFMLIFLLGGMIYLSKFEIKSKRKRSFMISTSLFILVNSFVSVLYFLGTKDYDLLITDNQFEVTGFYGDEWPLQDVQKIKLLDEMPNVSRKENAFAVATIAKGYFSVDGYGSSLLFLHKNVSPYLCIKLPDKTIFINAKTAAQTREWYEELTNRIAGS
ncbi:DUF3784 domain-containing protein [Bacillaceae bacterium Marseille-Q3522]|nr:DUF3784 domain-containing protein [Bacillaceae bacterium Marseille-Q3522]